MENRKTHFTKQREYQKIPLSNTHFLSLSRFKEMDYHAVEEYHLRIELMMENAGLQLASLIAHSVPNKDVKILIGVGNGNNGGGGLVAARRLSAWGYTVFLDAPMEIDKELPKKQWSRALAFGAKTGFEGKPDVWVDAYLGFSQRLPLSEALLNRIEKANSLHPCLRISLDLPTGFLGDLHHPYFEAKKILTLAMAKDILLNLPKKREIFIADLGIPNAVYAKFDVVIPPFHKDTILQLDRE